jgi:beta-glucosidase
LRHVLFNDIFPVAAQTGQVNFVYKRSRIPEAAHTQDFIGVNYYTRDRVAFDLFDRADLFSHSFFPPGSDLSDEGSISNEPEGMFEALKWAHNFGLPIIITENGVECKDDHIRPRYLLQHLHQVWRAANFNWRLKGYFHWTLTDNFEWERGWTERFGLWELDPETQIRRKRPSVDLYAAICRENGITSDMVSRFAPEISSKLFP